MKTTMEIIGGILVLLVALNAVMGAVNEAKMQDRISALEQRVMILEARK